MSDTRKTMALVRDGQAEGKSVDAVVDEIQHKVPYQLNNQKPMHELVKETPDENWLWELEAGSNKRAASMWVPLRDMLIYLRTQVHAAAHESGTN